MDKNAIKKYAVWAREELLRRVAAKAEEYGVSKSEIVPAGADAVDGRLLSPIEKTQRQKLIAEVRKNGYEQVIEEAAYTWFNRFIALRFMEVNGHLPSHVRVFADEAGGFRPQILAEALHLDMKGLDQDRVIAFKQANDTDGLYKYLLITQCNALSGILPRMFQKIEDYTELLFPENVLREGSVIERMVADIKEDDWKDQVQIIGWLYQYYNTVPKDAVFAALKKNIKVSKENIPAATQLFTPDWIVRYMVENSLGRLWVEGHPGSKARYLPTPAEQSEYLAGTRDDREDFKWHYYLEEAEQTPEVQAQLEGIRAEYRGLAPEQIRLIDPCMGSGHILVYAFDLLMQLYLEYGYTARDAVRSILENNLYGLDIDDRAAQLAYFSVMMKAAQYDSRFLRRGSIPQPHVYAIAETGGIGQDALEYFANGDAGLKQDIETVAEQMRDVKEYGSLLTVSPVDFGALYARFDEIIDDVSMYKRQVLDELLPMVRVAEMLAGQYDVVCTNPPYMAASNASAKVQEYLKKNFPDSKSDLFACFIERCRQFARQNGYQAMITQHAWMFLSSYEKLRAKLQAVDTVNMAHLGARAFEEIGGEVVQTTSFVLRQSRVEGYKGTYCRLVEPNTQQGKEDAFLAGENRYTAVQDNFSKIPGSPIAYWVSDSILSVFGNKKLSDYGRTCQGLATADNRRFLRLWFECNLNNIFWTCKSHYESEISEKMWYPCTKGGSFRRWYGNSEYLVNWKNDGTALKSFSAAVIRNPDCYFKEGYTWSTISSGKFSMRYSPVGFIFESKGSKCFIDKQENFLYILSMLNTVVAQEMLSFLAPTLDYHEGPVSRIPVIVENAHKSIIEELTMECIAISHTDWDITETSWGFKKNPLV